MRDKNGPRVDGFHQVSIQEPKIGNGDAKDEKEDDDNMSEFDLDLDDYENREEAWAEANFLEKGILAVQFGAISGYQSLKRITKGYFLKLILLIAFAAYFIAAMIHRYEPLILSIICQFLSLYFLHFNFLSFN